jgi:hypothetical protein
MSMVVMVGARRRVRNWKRFIHVRKHDNAAGLTVFGAHSFRWTWCTVDNAVVARIGNAAWCKTTGTHNHHHHRASLQKVKSKDQKQNKIKYYNYLLCFRLWIFLKK